MSTTPPAVSVVVPSYAGATRLPVLLDALAQQDESDFEVVVVVDGVVDDTEAVVAACADVPVRAVVLPDNRGRAAALNAGFDAAHGRVLVRCDDDLEPRPDFVSARLAAHVDEVRGVVGVCRNVLADSPYARCYGWDAEQATARTSYAAGPQDTWRLWGGNVSVPREVWERVGPYDAATFRGYGWEDVDWGYRLHLAGVPVAVDPAVEVRHHVASDSATKRAQRSWWSGLAKARFDRKHGLSTDSRQAPLPGVWGRLVDRTSDRLTDERVVRAGQRVDRALGRVPVPVGRKLVALLVESAFRAGERAGHTAADEDGGR